MTSDLCLYFFVFVSLAWVYVSCRLSCTCTGCTCSGSCSCSFSVSSFWSHELLSPPLHRITSNVLYFSSPIAITHLTLCLSSSVSRVHSFIRKGRRMHRAHREKEKCVSQEAKELTKGRERERVREKERQNSKGASESKSVYLEANGCNRASIRHCQTQQLIPVWAWVSVSLSRLSFNLTLASSVSVFLLSSSSSSSSPPWTNHLHFAISIQLHNKTLTYSVVTLLHVTDSRMRDARFEMRDVARTRTKPIQMSTAIW